MTQASPSKTAQPERLLRLPDVEALVGLRKSSIYDAVKRGEFPAPVKLSRRAVCWPASAIDAWITERITAAGR
ncbi:MAG: AlpA family transcriptional regulator [Polaromonas sp.]|uniref:helix-turn-helix transcriptional regulator n=1 Tax=Polaromonas sp. TaxID=1869339 RepID=UPI002488C06C|nr:AlpA family transcriptional regulator [Polaromonas sp.]MDI1267801.1 AlpA family transcriptional regulator [Polaromonas sp.]